MICTCTAEEKKVDHCELISRVPPLQVSGDSHAITRGYTHSVRVCGADRSGVTPVVAARGHRSISSLGSARSVIAHLGTDTVVDGAFATNES
jgi:hypothetical protein